jgi:hypothetical protein
MKKREKEPSKLGPGCSLLCYPFPPVKVFFPPLVFLQEETEEMELES